MKRIPLGAVLAMVLMTFVTLGLADFFFGKVVPPRSHAHATQGEGTRLLVLREAGVLLDTVVSPSADYVPGATTLDRGSQRLRTDANGFIRGAEDISASPDIIFFGGSTTECLYVGEEHRFPSRVGSLLRKTNGDKVVTANAGVSGNHSLHSVVSLLAKGIPTRPSAVVLMENINDLVTLQHTGSYWGKGPQSRALVVDANIRDGRRKWQKFVSSALDWWTPNIAAYIAERFPRVARIAGLAKAPPADEWEGFRGRTEVSFDQISADFRSSLTSFVRLAKSWGITPVLMTQPNVYDDHQNRLLPGTALPATPTEVGFAVEYAEFTDIIREVAAAEGCQLIDLAVAVKPSEEFLYDPVHLNEAGSRRAAQIIAENLANNSTLGLVLAEPDNSSSTVQQ